MEDWGILQRWWQWVPKFTWQASKFPKFLQNYIYLIIQSLSNCGRVSWFFHEKNTVYNIFLSLPIYHHFFWLVPQLSLSSTLETLTFSVPRNNMCSQKWANPGRSSGSHILPKKIQKKIDNFHEIMITRNQDIVALPILTSIAAAPFSDVGSLINSTFILLLRTSPLYCRSSCGDLGMSLCVSFMPSIIEILSTLF